MESVVQQNKGMRNFGSLLPVFLDNYFIEGLDQVAMEITSGEDERETGRVSFRARHRGNGQ